MVVQKKMPTQKKMPRSVTKNHRYFTGVTGGVQQQSAGQCPVSPSGGHWWLIETPDGDTSSGVCRYCREQKVFTNSSDEAIRNELLRMDERFELEGLS